MTRRSRLIGSAVLLLGLALPVCALAQHGFAVTSAPPVSASRPAAPMADAWSGWSYNATLVVQNNATTVLPAGYTVQLVLDTGTLIGQGKMLADCSDLRISCVTGGNDVELDRLVQNANTSATTVTFRTQAAIAVAGTDAGYSLHYGRADAGAPPANPASVYAFYDDFETGGNPNWNLTKGSWAVAADGSNHLLRYTGGGAAWALAYVPLANASNIDYVAKVRASASTNWIGLAFRIQDNQNFLTFYESKDVGLFKYAEIKTDNHTILAQPGFSMSAGLWYRVHLQALGNQLQARIWQDGSAEPATWQVTTSDATFNTATGIGATQYNQVTASDWDEMQVRRLVAIAPTVSVVENQYSLNINTIGSGTVSKSPDKATYSSGDVVTLTATPAGGWAFSGWSGGLTGSASSAQLTIQGNTTVTATFVNVTTYTLTVNTLGSGSVTASPPGPYHYGDVVSLTATPESGWTLTGWSGALSGSTNPASVTIQDNTVVTASFGMLTAPWWSASWGYRARVTVTNASATEVLPAGYSVHVLMDGATMVATGQVLGSGADVRVVGFDGISNAELNREVENIGSSQTEVWFALPRAIAPGGQDDGFYVYYGNAAAGAPPADGSQVFLFYEDWEQGTTHWTNAGGLDAGNTGTMGHTVISTSDFVSGAHSQQFPVKIGGGDAFTGYIPVTAGGRYAIGVWAKSATGADLPVGLDPYTSGYSKGTEIWLWTNEWTVGTQWGSRSGTFTTPPGTAFVKIKSEWWLEGPGTAPVYLDDLSLRLAATTEPTLVLGAEEGTATAPTISTVTDDGPVNLGGTVTVSAAVSASSGTIDAVTLRLVSPESRDVAMNLVAGTSTSGTWQGQFTPNQGGTYTYRVLAHSSFGRSALSAARTVQVADTQAPQITLVSVVNPILVKNTQTLVVNVTDNGQVGAVTATVNGTAYPMTQQGSQYTYAWQVTTVGTVGVTVRATDSANNQASLVVSFVSQAREVDVCAWLGGKNAAASWSIDDGNTSCLDVLQAAGIRGTYYYNGNTTQGWFATYSAAGMEIGCHSVDHPCNTPTCSPSCTGDAALWAIPFQQADMIAYRQNELDPCIAAIEAGTGKPVVSMAWPCGCADALRMTAAQPYFLGVRGYYDYIAQLTWVQGVDETTPADFMNLNSDASYLQSDIDLAAAQGKWAIVTSHGDCSGISYIGSLQNVLWVAPVGEVLKYIKVRNAAQFSNYSRSGLTIAFDAAHNLPTMTRQQVSGAQLLPIVFDNPATLKVHLLDTDVVLNVQVDGVTTSYAVLTMDGTRYVTFDAALNTSRHVTLTLSKPTPVIDQVADNGPVDVGGSAQVSARVIESDGPVQAATLHVTSPVTADYPMTLVNPATGTYAASFTPDQIATYSCFVSATNDEGVASQSPAHAFVVRDVTPPQWRNLAQARDAVTVGQSNTLSAEALDAGGLQWAYLATDESGTWQELNGAGSEWWNREWTQRRAVTIHETAGLARAAETVDVPVSSADFTGLTSAVAQLRVADDTRHEVPSQVYGEQNVGGVITCHLVFQADVAANAQRTYYVYYGNAAATAPAYTADLTSSTAGTVLTVRNAHLDLDIDTAGGVVSRVRLPMGTNTNLPLATQSNAYWGWHQVCSSTDGNIAGKNTLCSGGVTPASGLVLAVTNDGPLVKTYEFTSQKGGATYRMTYRFFANAPYYQYELSRTGTGAYVLNNFWYANGSAASLGTGSGGSPAAAYDTYGSGADQVRIASIAAADVGLIDGTDNDGTQLGASDYRMPTATGLSLCVATGATPAATQDVVARYAAPLTTAVGAAESAPVAQYGSPLDAGSAKTWTATAFTWQNGAIAEGTVVHWRIDYCDATGNCRTTDPMSFTIGPVNGVAAVVPSSTWITSVTPCVTVPVVLTRTTGTSQARAVSVKLQLSPELRLCDPVTPKNSIHAGSWLAGYESSFQVIDRGNGLYQVDQAILGLPCGIATGGQLFTLDLTGSGADGTGALTVTAVTARDCDNGTLSFAPGAAASVLVDRTPPGTVADLAVSPGAAGSSGRRKVAVAFTTPGDAVAVEVYRAPFGSYPLYERPPGTGAVPAAPTLATVSAAPWQRVSTLAGPGSDDPGTRDYWYYAVVTRDAHGNGAISPPSSGALDYVLGDVHNGLEGGECTGDDAVTLSDISYLGAHYGLAVPTDATYACLDVGPTTDYATTSRPRPDGMLDFEDLVLFALDFGTTVPAVPARAHPATLATAARTAGPATATSTDALALQVPALPGVGGVFDAAIEYEGHGEARAVSVELSYDPAVVQPVGVADGDLLASQASPHVTLSAHAGNVDVALLGGAGGLAGRGDLARVTFRVVGPGEAHVAVRTARARDASNRESTLGGTLSKPAAPAATGLSRAMPTPFAGTTAFELSLARAGSVRLAVYGVNGRRIRTLASGDRDAGVYRVVWDGRDDDGRVVPPGMYFARLTARDQNFTRSLVRVR